MTFEQWMKNVDQILHDICGFTSEDLADFMYYDAWEDGAKPEDVAKGVLEENDFYIYD